MSTMLKNIQVNEFEFLMGNSELIDKIPLNFRERYSKRKEEIFAFFDKIPIEKAMQVKLPDEKTWIIYNTRLRFYAQRYRFNLSISAVKKDSGYFIFIKKKGEEEDGKENLEKQGV